MFAFKNGEQGDMFVQKAPACTIQTLAKALKKIYQADTEIKVIGTRHGEKLFETLVNREEMVKAKDLGRFFCIPADTRDLNYNKFFSNGESKISKIKDYTSHNTERLDFEGIKDLLMKLDFIKKDFK